MPLRFISAQDVLDSLLPQGFEIKDWGGSGRGGERSAGIAGKPPGKKGSADL